jgi:hypothetical protein
MGKIRMNILRGEIAYKINEKILDRIMAQAASRRPLAAEARVRARISPCGSYGGQSSTGTVFSPRCLAFSCQYHSVVLFILTYQLGDEAAVQRQSHPIDMNNNNEKDFLD